MRWEGMAYSCYLIFWYNQFRWLSEPRVLNKLRYQSSPLAYSIDAGGARSAFLVTLTWVVHAYSAGTDMVGRTWDLCGYALNAKGFSMWMTVLSLTHLPSLQCQPGGHTTPMQGSIEVFGWPVFASGICRTSRPSFNPWHCTVRQQAAITNTWRNCIIY